MSAYPVFSGNVKFGPYIVSEKLRPYLKRYAVQEMYRKIILEAISLFKEKKIRFLFFSRFTIESTKITMII